VFHRLSRRKQPGIERGGTFVFGHDLRAFIGNANDRGAGLSLRLLVDDAEYLFEPLYLAFGLTAMLFEGRLQLFILGSFRHFWQCREYLLFREIDVFQGVVKQLIELLGFFGHPLSPFL
jgi:hypothetical protein